MRSALRLAVLSGVTAVTAVTAVLAIAPGRAQAPGAPSPFDSLHFRSIGPAGTGGRIHDLQIDPRNPAVLYVGAATGGIWKSENNGVTWTRYFRGPARQHVRIAGDLRRELEDHVGGDGREQ